MKTSEGIALGLGALVLAGGATAAFIFVQRRRTENAQAQIPTNVGQQLIYASDKPNGTSGQAPAPGATTNPVVAQTNLQKTAADVKAVTDIVKAGAGALKSIADDFKGFFSDSD